MLKFKQHLDLKLRLVYQLYKLQICTQKKSDLFNILNYGI
jgi:hypothetical protein